MIDTYETRQPIARRAPLSWKLRNMLRWDFIRGWADVHVARFFSRATGVPTITSQLSFVWLGSDGEMVDYGVVCYRVITTTFVNFLVDNMQAETSEWGDFKYHGSGTGTTSPAASDTALESEVETRATGTQTEGTNANEYKTVADISYTATRSITEHGVFSQSSGGTLLDRSTFTALSVVSGNSIQFTLVTTFNSGG